MSEVTVNTATGVRHGADYVYGVRHGADYVYLEDAVVGVVPFTVPAPGQSLQSAGVHYVHPDHLDTPRLVTDTLNRARWRWDSDPFGASPPNENPAGLGVFPLRLRFPGQVADRESNTYYNYFRDYSPEIGRYIESDPIGIKGGMNTYTYVRGNPTRWTDPRGLEDPVIDPPTTPSGQPINAVIVAPPVDPVPQSVVPWTINNILAPVSRAVTAICTVPPPPPLPFSGGVGCCKN